MIFSIIIPTYLRNEDLYKCLNTLLPNAQEFKKDLFEIIVTDDSPSGTAETVVSKFEIAKWVQGPRKGPAANRNHGAKLAKGEWLIFLDDDCLPTRGLLNNYFEAINHNHNCKVFEGSIFPYGEKRSPLEFGPFNTTGGYLWSCNFCISKQLFFDLDGFDEFFKYPHLEDNDLKKRIDQLGLDIVFVEQAEVKHAWKKISSGARLALYHEMSIYYYKKHNIQYSLIYLCKKIILSHFGMMRTHLFSKDIFKALWEMSLHVLVTIKNYNKWNKIRVVN